MVFLFDSAGNGKRAGGNPTLELRQMNLFLVSKISALQVFSQFSVNHMAMAAV